MVGTRNNSAMTAEQIRELVATEVAQAVVDAMADVTREVHATIPTLFTGIRDQLGVMMDERLAAFTATGGGQPRGFTYRDFSVCSPPEFKGETDPKIALRWISDVEGVFHTSGCPADLKVRFSLNLLRGPAKDWWGLQAATLSEAQLAALTWGEFVARFRQQYVPRVEVQRITREFLSLQQTTETVMEITTRFREMASFCPEFAATEDMKMTRYLSMLRDDIREFVDKAHLKQARLRASSGNLQQFCAPLSGYSFALRGCIGSLAFPGIGRAHV